jgi:outer membrane protein OmpA-like peptidoglycan-associated protein
MMRHAGVVGWLWVAALAVAAGALPSAARAQSAPRARLQLTAHHLEVPGRITFGAQNQPDPRSQAVLDQVATYLRAHPNVGKVRVEVHSDGAPNAKAAQQQTQARADAIVAHLVSRGVEPASLEARGFGGTQPRHSPATPEGKAFNIRVAFTLLTLDDQPVAPMVARVGVADVAVTSPGSATRVSSRGEPLTAATVVEAPAEVDVPLTLAAQGRALVQRGSVVSVLGPGDPDAPRGVELRAGRATLEVYPGAPVPAVLSTATLVAQVTEGTLDAQLLDAGAVRLSLLSGAAVKVFKAPRVAKDKPLFTLAAGTSVTVDAAQKPAKPVKLPKAPAWVSADPQRLLALAATARSLPLEWKAVDGATGYVLQAQPVTDGAAVKAAVAGTLAPEGALAVSAGLYDFTVAAVDAAGLQGPFAVGPRLVVAASPVDGLAPVAGAPGRVVVGRVHGWPEGILCNGEERTRFRKPGLLSVTCTDPDGEVFSPVEVEVVPVTVALPPDAGVDAGANAVVVLTVSADAPLPPSLTVQATGPARLRAARARPVEGDGRTRSWDVEVAGFTPGKAALSITVDATGALLGEAELAVREPPPPPPPPPQPKPAPTAASPAAGAPAGPGALAGGPSPVAGGQPNGPCLLNLRSWCAPAVLAGVTGAASVVALPLALAGLGAATVVANTDLRKSTPDLLAPALLGVGGVTATLVLAGVVGTVLLTVSAISLWGQEHAR